MKILVVGGTGLVGSPVVKELLQRGADLRLLVRDAKAKVPAGVEVAVGELLDAPAVERAMTGVDKLY
ncbi:MAG: NAD(P)H-binding protein, partial [Candidatus Eremiobacteraeota bacterium]|nr:NAD(P)H-binding protein [Candidatus Eremiobacteraeota bacterium]